MDLFHSSFHRPPGYAPAAGLITCFSLLPCLLFGEETRAVCTRAAITCLFLVFLLLVGCLQSVDGGGFGGRFVLAGVALCAHSPMVFLDGFLDGRAHIALDPGGPVGLFSGFTIEPTKALRVKALAS